MESHFDYPIRDELSLLDYTRRITSVIQSDPRLQGAWVVAELSDVNRHPSGHCYMELIQKDEASGKTLAKMRATIWKWVFQDLDRKFFVATDTRIQTGMKVLLRLEAKHSELYGLSANVVDIDPKYTLGDLERQRREILLRLQRDGVINVNKGRNLCVNPQKIAVISAAGAAGYGDFVNQLHSSDDGYVFYTRLFEAAMQGVNTSASVRAALDAIMAVHDTMESMGQEGFDCVVIIRGGGSTTDLNGFDDYELAKAVATYPLPIIVGIGHERDRNVLDEIAHTRCKTPTAVAEFLVSALRYAERRADDAASAAIDTARQRIALQHERLARATAVIPTIAKSKIDSAMQRLMSVPQVIAQANVHLMLVSNQRLDYLYETLKKSAQERCSRETDRLLRLSQLTEVLSPQNTLRRGYSITRADGKAIKDAKDLTPGTLLTTTLATGEIHSTVK